jgi:tetratricopeptide (TPR) repeat protein
LAVTLAPSDRSAVVALRQEAVRLMRAKDWQGALGRIEQGLRMAPADARWHIYRAQCFTALGRLPQACVAASDAYKRAPPDPALFDAIGSVFSLANEQVLALAAFDRAVALAPANAHFIFNRATVYRFLGRLEEAEAAYDRVIALRPTDYEAHLNRSELRTQSAERNHIGELESLITQGIADWHGEVQVRYALAKEYEDTGRYEESFQHLARGARKRRDHMQYDVAVDVATVNWIMEAFAEAPRGPGGDPGKVAAGESPIFIVGLPRSGTTLVDRILGSHSTVHSAGELNHFALCMVDAVRRRSGGAASSRRELVARSAGVDFAALGRDYLGRVPQLPAGALRFTDKMPLNYLYLGLIHRALPHAKIVHVIRQPMAVCYAMYKTLFKDGYPFSYDLSEIGRYYLAYRRLMDHWQATLPGAIHCVRYEALVQDQVGESRRLLDFCGLEWQEACAEFHRNAAPTTTASAVQVRRRIYDSSVSQWRHYAAHLAGLEEQLHAAGIDTDAPT